MIFGRGRRRGLDGFGGGGSAAHSSSTQSFAATITAQNPGSTSSEMSPSRFQEWWTSAAGGRSHSIATQPPHSTNFD